MIFTVCFALVLPSCHLYDRIKRLAKTAAACKELKSVLIPKRSTQITFSTFFFPHKPVLGRTKERGSCDFNRHRLFGSALIEKKKGSSYVRINTAPSTFAERVPSVASDLRKNGRQPQSRARGETVRTFMCHSSFGSGSTTSRIRRTSVHPLSISFSTAQVFERKARFLIDCCSSGHLASRGTGNHTC